MFSCRLELEEEHWTTKVHSIRDKNVIFTKKKGLIQKKQKKNKYFSNVNHKHSEEPLLFNTNDANSSFQMCMVNIWFCFFDKLL